MRYCGSNDCRPAPSAYVRMPRCSESATFLPVPLSTEPPQTTPRACLCANFPLLRSSVTYPRIPVFLPSEELVAAPEAGQDHQRYRSPIPAGAPPAPTPLAFPSTVDPSTQQESPMALSHPSLSPLNTP
ncbi:hypothetical protein FA13DRAFT_1091027 [Coprinellus micaceus]|nr:hypothetical protein FA13DRAFT_1091027 [Coprinellus micaceus]